MSTSNPMSQNHVLNKKRGRDDTELEPNSTDPKRVNLVPEPDAIIPESYVKNSTELINPDEVDQIPGDIMDILNDSDIVHDHDSPSQDLDSVIKSFEEEILQLTSTPIPPEISGESQPNLGYLLGASDDELGLPPTTTTSSPDENEPKNDPFDSTIIDPDAIEMRNMIEFDQNELLSYDSLQLGLSEAPKVVDENGFETVGGLFDSPEMSDVTGLTW